MNSTNTKTSNFKVVLNSFFRTLPKGSEAWLYGSRARGDAHSGSDWDVLVLLNKDNVTIDDDRDITMRLKMLGYDYGQEVNPQLFTFKDWNKYSSTPFNHNVLKDRVRLS